MYVIFLKMIDIIRKLFWNLTYTFYPHIEDLLGNIVIVYWDYVINDIRLFCDFVFKTLTQMNKNYLSQLYHNNTIISC